MGHGPMLDIAMAAWSECQPDVELQRVEIELDGDHEFRVSPLDALTPTDATAFVAWDDQFLNFRRQELMGVLKAKGFAMPPLVCPGSFVAASVKIAENCYVGRGTVLESGAQLGYNSVIGAGCTVGASARIGNSVWLGRRVTLGDDSRVGANTTVADGLTIGSNVEIGRLCVLKRPGEYYCDVAARTYHLAAFNVPITITGS